MNYFDLLYAKKIGGGGGGGGNVPAVRKDVNFFDYDGTIVYSYTAAEFAELSAMPVNPSHDGLTAQGWNWSLSDAKAYAASYGKLDVGQMYASDTPDGATLLHIRLGEGRLKPYLGLTGNSSGTAVSIDWGDGSAAESVALDANTVYTPHEYSSAGEYVIAVSVTSGSISFNGDSDYDAGSNIFRKSGTPNDRDDIVYQNVLMKIEIGNAVIFIGDYAFQKCYSLTSVTMSSAVTSIGTYAFQNCNSLTSITIPNSVTSIDEYAFNYCCSLNHVTFPDSIDNIGTYSFGDCYSLKTIAISNNSVTSINANTFDRCFSLTSVTIPDSVIFIGDGAFSGCFTLTSVTIPNSVTFIDQYVFDECHLLTCLTIPDSITSLYSSFYGCYSLKVITMPDSITSIYSYAFQGCFSLTTITISKSVTSIYDNILNMCYGVGLIRFEGITPPTVSNINAWRDIPTDCIILAPALVVDLYMNGTNYPDKNTYKYIGFATYGAGETLPTVTTDETHTLTWYATQADAVAQTNPITQGNGSEVYAVATAV